VSFTRTSWISLLEQQSLSILLGIEPGLSYLYKIAVRHILNFKLSQLGSTVKGKTYYLSGISIF
jgi:hypothetical protein